MTVLSGALMGNNENQTSLGKYQLIASLGQGGMAKVYLALVSGPAGVNKLMVVKVVQNEVLSGPEGGLALFWDEARLATRLVHPNIVHTYEVGEVDGNYFLAMEYLDGQTYRVLQARAAQEPLPLHEALRILSEVARGLHYAHELRDFHGEPLGVVHRDVSPQNVFLTYDGQVKLIDFGIAKTRDADHETRVGLIKGKLNYIAPEQLRGDVLDRRADVFALGIMLWEAIAGRRFAGGPGVSEVAKVHARIKGEEPNIRVVKPGTAEPLAAIIDRAIALDRDQRFDDAASFADALDAYIESTGQRPSTKTLSGWMHSLFEQDRAAMHKVIEERIQALLQRAPGGGVSDMPILPVAEEGNTGSGILKGRNLWQLASARPAAQSSVDGAWIGRDRTRLRWAAAGMGVVVSVAAATALLSPTAADRNAPAGADSAPRAAASSAPGAHVVAAAPVADKVNALPLNASVTLTVSPPNAQVTIDGASISAPFRGAFPKGATLHRVEATAPGHRPFVRLMPFNQDREITIALEAAAEPAKKSAPVRARSGVERHAAAPERHAFAGAAPSAQEEEPPRAPAVNDEPARPASVGPGTEIRPAKTRLGRSQLDTADPYSN